MVDTRKQYLDIAKGILIILVVLGHSPTLNPFLGEIIYWFHMPAFFIISGYLYRAPIEKGMTINDWTRKNFPKYFIPYISFFLLTSIVIYRNFGLQDITNFLYGGRMYGGVFWYIPVLFFTIILFSLIIKKIKKPVVFIIIISLYVLGHLESIFYLPNNSDYISWGIKYKAPLNIDVVLVSLTYFSIGYYFKEVIKKFTEKSNMLFFATLSIICLSLIVLSAQNFFSFHIDMKLSYYKNILLDLVIPVLFFAFVLKGSQYLSNFSTVSKVISFIGKNTLVIMYLHLPINGVLQPQLGYGNTLFLIVGVAFPLIFSYIVSKNKILDYLFTGTRKNSSIRAIRRVV